MGGLAALPHPFHFAVSITCPKVPIPFPDKVRSGQPPSHNTTFRFRQSLHFFYTVNLIRVRLAMKDVPLDSGRFL